MDPGDAHYARLADLLDVERREEVARLAEARRSRPEAEREARGETIGRLEVRDEEGGLAGRWLVTLAKANGLPLPPGAGKAARGAESGGANSGLTESQAEAVAFALDAPDVALIHGPPGTGKTTAVIALIAAAVARGERVLACAASNAAVDLLAERCE